jgi:hypothetical protein
MVIIGTEKFKAKDEDTNLCNWQWFSWYMIYTVHRCSKCGTLYMEEPKKVYG